MKSTQTRVRFTCPSFSTSFPGPLIFPPLSRPSLILGAGRSKRVPGDEVDFFSFLEAKCKDKTLVKALPSESKCNKYTCVQQTLSRSQKGLTLSMKARDILLKRAIIVLLNNLLYQKVKTTDSQLFLSYVTSQIFSHFDWFNIIIYWRTDIQMTSLTRFWFLCYIKQINSILPYVCSVRNHRRRQNAVGSSVTHSATPRVFFLLHFYY